MLKWTPLALLLPSLPVSVDEDTKSRKTELKTMSHTQNNISSWLRTHHWKKSAHGEVLDLVFWWEAELQREMTLEFPFSVWWLSQSRVSLKLTPTGLKWFSFLWIFFTNNLCDKTINSYFDIKSYSSILGMMCDFLGEIKNTLTNYTTDSSTSFQGTLALRGEINFIPKGWKLLLSTLGNFTPNFTPEAQKGNFSWYLSF